MSTNKYAGTCPLSQKQLIDEFFIEYRGQILAVAAFLDRLDRAAEHDAAHEFRYQAFRRAAAELMSNAPGRAERVQMILSDPRLELLEARDRQNAFGAFDAGQAAPEDFTPPQGDGR